ncbi:unnamed protein product, partial [Ectocarpus sp. 8 AP-2014]
VVAVGPGGVADSPLVLSCRGVHRRQGPGPVQRDAQLVRELPARRILHVRLGWLADCRRLRAGVPDARSPQADERIPSTGFPAHVPARNRHRRLSPPACHPRPSARDPEDLGPIPQLLYEVLVPGSALPRRAPNRVREVRREKTGKRTARLLPGWVPPNNPLIQALTRVDVVCTSSRQRSLYA